MGKGTLVLNLTKLLMIATNQQVDFKEGSVTASLSALFVTTEW